MLEIDQALDAVGVILEPPGILCGECMTKMERVNARTIKCPMCGKMYSGV